MRTTGRAVLAPVVIGLLVTAFWAGCDGTGLGIVGNGNGSGNNNWNSNWNGNWNGNWNSNWNNNWNNNWNSNWNSNHSGCPNGVCEPPDETPANCPQDCWEAWCGNGYCEPGEEWSCPEDCENVWCGNGYCEPGEEEWCPEDCGGWCGDGYCDPGEEEWCPEDCGGWCGNGYCEPGEEEWCPEDCEYAWCGNGSCELGENQWSCPEDCSGGGWCGDGQCDMAAGENPQTCPQDCDSGELSCQGLVYCERCCNASNPGCVQACEAGADLVTVTQLSSFRSCLATLCSSECVGGSGTANWNACYLCAQNHCPNICPWDPMGTGGCFSLNECLVGCPTVATSGTPQTCPMDPGINCTDGCYGQADPQGAQLYEGMITCIRT